MKLSVVVCTHNRCDVLRRTLDSLISQDYPILDYEVLVIDNLSTDKTKDVVDELIRNENNEVNVRYVYEDKIGLSYARNRGITESVGDIIAFIDDDARADKQWLSEMSKFYETREDAMCVGGKVILEWASPKPSWWTPELDSQLSAVDYGNEVQRLSYPLYPYGTNISFRKEIFKTVGLFNPELGRIGNKLLAGEETEVCLNIEKNGKNIYYCPDMVVYHLIQSNRITKKFINERYYWSGRSCAMIELRHFGKKHNIMYIWGMIKQIVRLCLTIRRNDNVLRLIYYKLGYIQQSTISLIWGCFTN